MSYEHIVYEVTDAIATVTLNRPAKLNAYTATMGAELTDAFRAADEDDAVRVVIVTGAGRGFCAGADISGGANAFDSKSGSAAMFNPAPSAEASGRRKSPGFIEAIYNCRKPSIAAFNGPAVGVGITLALPMTSASRPARRGSASSSRAAAWCRRPAAPGSCPAWRPRPGATLVPVGPRLRRRRSARGRPRQRSRGARPPARPRPRDRRRDDREHRSRLARADAPHALALCGQPNPFGVIAMDGALSVELGAGPDVKEGVTAFLEKRKPAFPGKVSAGLPKSYVPAPR